MANYSLSVCLTDLQGAQVQANQNGKQFIFIPIEDADLFLSPKNGKVYLNLTMWEKSNGIDQYGKTHGVKQTISQAKREAIGAEAAKKLPFIGSAKDFVIKNRESQPQPQQQSVYQQQPPQGYQQPAYPQNPAPQNNSFGDGMPF